jgi:hypothetical protein
MSASCAWLLLQRRELSVVVVEWHTRQLEVLELEVAGIAGSTPADDTVWQNCHSEK